MTERPAISILPRSLTTRLAIMTGTWVMLGLVFAWMLVTNTITHDASQAFDARLVSLADALAAATGLKDAHPYLVRPVSEPRFDVPLSGYYYQIEAPNETLLTSPSLGTGQLPAGRSGHHGILMSELPGPGGQTLRMAERDIAPPDTPGTLHILVAAATDEMTAEIAHTRRLLALGFVLLGTALVGGIVVLVSVSLADLRRLRFAVAELRAGGQLDDRYPVPSEVGPLVEEIEALVRQNRATVARARGHVGDLAHALHTRLSIMRNAVDIGDTAILGAELTAADRLVQHHLTRARTPSPPGETGTDMQVTIVAEDIAHALRMLFQERALTIQVEGEPSIRARCEYDDLAEMLGNLMENACKWTKSLVRVTVSQEDQNVTVTVSDDGMGLPSDLLRAMPDRAARPDETVPGRGLGLAITTDLAGLYGGRLDLVSPGPDGGLAVYLRLPRGRRAATIS